jgi:hypothetical protein
MRSWVDTEDDELDDTAASELPPSDGGELEGGPPAGGAPDGESIFALASSMKDESSDFEMDPSELLSMA